MRSPDASTIKHQEIAHSLRDELAAGRYGSAGRLPSEAQLVRRFGVSRPTAARALRTLVEAGLIERRAGSGTFVRPDRPVDGAESNGLMALLIPDPGNTKIFNLISGEIAGLAHAHHYQLIWGASPQPKSQEPLTARQAEELCAQYVERRVCGVFFAPHELAPGQEQINRQLATLLREAGITVVLLDRDVTPFPERSDHDLVGIDNFAGGYLMAEHLLKLGCRELRFVARPLSAPTVNARIAGVREALARRRIIYERPCIQTGDTVHKSFVRDLVADRKADALICANDHTAAALLQTLRQINVQAPQDVRVVGFDDAEFATLLSPALTTVLQPYRDIAVAAFRLMIDRQTDPSLPPRHVTISPRLVVRDSCGAYLPRTQSV